MEPFEAPAPRDNSGSEMLNMQYLDDSLQP
jgi:hypothetical protein